MSALAGRRIVVTRPTLSADDFCARLDEAGAVPVRIPAIEIGFAAPDVRMDATIGGLDRYDWVVFTSASGVEAAAHHLERLGRSLAALGATKVAAIGPVTAAALAAHGINVDAMPEEFLGERIADAVGDPGGRRFLLLRADIASAALPDRLRARGGQVDDVAVYTTRERSRDPAAANGLRGGVDAITFTSPSTVRGFTAVVGAEWRDLVGDAAVITIGPVTSVAAHEAGMRVAAEAVRHDAAGLFDALASHFNRLAEATPWS